MPFIVIDRIVVDPIRRAEGLSAVGAAHEHHVASRGEAGRLHARQHVNIVIRARAGTIHRQENLPDQSFRIDRLAEIDDRRPRLTAVLWSKVGVTAPFFALVERTHQIWSVLRFTPPRKRLPFESTSSVPQAGELGMLIGFIQVTPPSVERLNCRPL